MYLSKVVLENFQAFEKGEFNLSPNLNILIGVTNVGKSSVARALSLILFNQWDKSWVRFGAKFCRITLLTNTGIEVIRDKGDKVNRYVLRLPGQPEQVFESFGTSVPEQIQLALRINAVQIDTVDTLNLNLAGQMDALFLLSQTGSYRAKVLGKLSGATYLDHAIRKLNNDKRQVTAAKEHEGEEITKFQKEVDKLTAIEAYSSHISVFDTTLSSIRCSQARIERIQNLLERVNALRDSWTRINQKGEILGALELNSINALSSKVDNIKVMNSLFTKVQNFKKDYVKVDKLQELLKPVDSSGITILAERVSKLKVLKDLSARVLKNSLTMTSISTALKDTTSQHEDALKQYNDKLRDAGVCPLCNRSTVEDQCVR